MYQWLEDVDILYLDKYVCLVYIHFYIPYPLYLRFNATHVGSIKKYVV